MILRLTIDGFPVRPELAQTLERLRQDPLFSRSQVRIVEGGLVGAVEHYRSGATAQLVIVEELGDEAILRDRLEDFGGRVRGRKRGSSSSAR